jgi:hypothetical protein
VLLLKLYPAPVLSGLALTPYTAAGVGGWAESGVNPAEYSRMLMRVACAYIEGADVRSVASLDGWASSPCASLNSYDTLSSLDACGSASDGCGGSGRDPAAAVALVDPRRALDTAHKLTKLPGSATACVVQLCPEQRSLIAANLVRLLLLLGVLLLRLGHTTLLALTVRLLRCMPCAVRVPPVRFCVCPPPPGRQRLCGGAWRPGDAALVAQAALFRLPAAVWGLPGAR